MNRQETNEDVLILAIESSCDETAVAIIDADGNMLANQVSTQIDFHARFGGVVPEIASRKHVEVIVSVVDADGCRSSPTPPGQTACPCARTCRISTWWTGRWAPGAAPHRPDDSRPERTWYR